MKTKSKTTSYIVRSIAAAALLVLSAQLSVAGSATWLDSPQDSAWENPNNWTAGGPPNGPSDIATFAASYRSTVNISTPVEVAGIVFTLYQDFNIYVTDSELTFSGTGVTNNSGTYQFFWAGNAGQIIFNNTSSAGDALILAGGRPGSITGKIIFNDSSTAGSARLDASSSNYGNPGIILFNGASTGGTAAVGLSIGNSGAAVEGLLDIRGHQSGVTVGSIAGSGDIYLGANDLAVSSSFPDVVSFYGVIDNFGQGGSLAKVGSGRLTLSSNTCFKDTVGLILVSGSTIKLDFTGRPDVIASLRVNGVSQPPGIYGGPMSGAPHILPEFEGNGTMEVGPISTLGNISTRAFVQTGDNVMIGGFIVEGTQANRVIIRAIGPELNQHGVPNALANPTLELYNDAGALIASNNNWATTIIGGIIRTNQVRDIRASGYAPSNPNESAMIVNLSPGNYTAIVRGVNNTTGVALAEVYDLSPAAHNSILGNISTRAFVQTGDNVMIGGFIVQGTLAKRVIIRAIGPELSQFGVPDPLANPRLELHNAAGALIGSNDNWQHTIIGGIITRDQVAAIRASGHAPTDPGESAIIANLPPGNYTAIVRGVNATTGVGLVEVYDLD